MKHYGQERTRRTRAAQSDAFAAPFAAEIPNALWDNCWLPTKRFNNFETFSLTGAAEVPCGVSICVAEEVARLFNARRADTGSPGGALSLCVKPGLPEEGYELSLQGNACEIVSGSEAGLLYGLYALARLLTLGETEARRLLSSAPRNDIRMIDHWDEFSGECGRGYSGKSIFYEGNQFRGDYGRLEDYARLLASIGINAVSINNVNVSRAEIAFLRPPHLLNVKRIAEIFIKYNIRLFLAVNFASPYVLGELDTADPLEPAVQEWWNAAVKKVYEQIPFFGGFIVKADSEGEPGPFAYSRTHAEGANMLARALAPFGGIIIWRCFVYNCRQDWRDRSIDRARSAFDTFKPHDGEFLENVILQAKFGPIDFQIREPVSPLFGAMPRTNMLIEMQITQEYTGQQQHICYLAPQWKEVLDFDTYADGKGSVASKIVGNAGGRPRGRGGMAAVGSVGGDANWTGHKLAQANWYAFGRLCWDPALGADEILREWIRLTFGLAAEDEDALFNLMKDSRETYEQYTVPLGVGFMCKPHFHYGPDVDGYEYDRWGTYHFADRDGIGNDRTRTTGTGFCGQYFEPNASMYDNLATCPDDLLLFFHHVPYTHVLQSGKTVIQHIYDTHFEGFERVLSMAEEWKRFKGKIRPEDYENVAQRLEEQVRCAREWRDQVNTYFYRKSGIADAKGRVIYR
ncbi:MAG: alpha-glucuronidase [Clostridiales bacterium]|jgi:alpha-glucuronidase|nr:alpha-glucuronidase [Clostridiales bacterium]